MCRLPAKRYSKPIKKTTIVLNCKSVFSLGFIYLGLFREFEEEVLYLVTSVLKLKRVVFGFRFFAGT